VTNGSSLDPVVGDAAQDLSAGDSIVFNADSKHVYENPGPAKAGTTT
jgi:quercetin dioxygenase-like cupin family protein